MKSFGLCHEIISPVILKSFGLSQDLPLSQNGQDFRLQEIVGKLKKNKGATHEFYVYSLCAIAIHSRTRQNRMSVRFVGFLNMEFKPVLHGSLNHKYIVIYLLSCWKVF